MPKVAADSWSRFLTPNLVGTPDLVGRSHTFEHDGNTLTVALPSEYGEGLKDSQAGGKAKVFGWQKMDEEDIPTHVSFPSVDIRIHIPEAVEIPEAALHRPPIAHDVVPEAQQRALEKMATSCEEAATKGFDVWLRTVRWITRDARIARPEVVGPKSGWSTYLMERTTNHRFWIKTVVMRIDRTHLVTPEEWEVIGGALVAGERSPVYFDLLFDAEEHLRIGDLLRSVVDGAIAAESFMRTRVIGRLPPGVTEGVIDHIESVPVQKLMDTSFRDTLSPEQERVYTGKTKSLLHKLFDSRNGCVHLGRADELSSEECSKFLSAIRALLEIGV